MISFTENYKNRVWKGHMLMKKQARQQKNFGKLDSQDQAMTRINTRYLLFDVLSELITHHQCTLLKPRT